MMRMTKNSGLSRTLVILVLALLILLIVSLSISKFVPTVQASPAYEDFTVYTEVDPNSHIAKTANHVDFQDHRTEDAYLYKDKGAGHFTDFTHKINIKSVSGALWHQAHVWLLSNDIDDAKGLLNTGKTAITVDIYKAGSGVVYLTLEEFYTTGEYGNSWSPMSENVWYYLTIQKSGTALTCKVYSDSARTNLLTTLSLTLKANHNFRYVFVCNTWNSNSAGCNGDEDVENLDLQEVSITVTSSPATGSGYVLVDGGAITTPQTYTWTVGDSHIIAANSPANLVSGQSQYVWTSWSDGGAQSHSITVPSSATTYTANFQLQYYITITSSGIGTDTSGTVATLGGNAKTQALLPYSQWFDNGASCSYAFSSPVAATSTKQYVWSSTSGLCQTPQQYEYYNTGDDSFVGVRGVYFKAQTFTVGAVGHAVTSVKLLLYRVGSPGTVTVSIRATDGTHPTGSDLTSGTINGNSLSTDSAGVWYEIALTSYALSADTKYAIVVRAPSGADYNNELRWRYDSTSPTYNGGNREDSDSSGVTWSSNTASDLMFEVWSNSQSNSFIVSTYGTITGTYTTQYKHTITSSPATGTGYLVVDGNAQTTPYTTDWWNSGSSHTIAANSPVTIVSGQKQYLYSSWSDSGAQSHSVSPASSTTYTANFQLQWKFDVSSSYNFGYETIGTYSEWTVENTIIGSLFTITKSGTADSITVALKWRTSAWTGKLKCAIYTSGHSRVANGVTEERTIALTSTAMWYTFNFIDPKPSLTASTGYVLVVYGESVAGDAVIPYNAGTTDQGHYQSRTYDGTFPASLIPTHDWFKCSVYCTYTIDSPTGAGWYNDGASVSSSVTRPVSGGTNVQYETTGWTGTGSLSSGGTSGSSTTGSFTITAYSTCTWNWKTQYQHTITSSPGTGLGFVTVDSVAQTTPYTTSWWDSGSSHTIAASGTVTIVSGQSQYAYSSWSDSGAQSHSVSPTAVTTYTAYFVTQYYFLVADARDSATGLGWYTSGTSVSSTVSRPISGGTGVQYETVGWTGTGSLSSGGGVGSTTTGSFTLLQYSTCTWNWKTQYRQDVSSSYDSPTNNGVWYDAGATASSSVTSPVSGGAGIQYVCNHYTGTGSAPTGSGVSVSYTINAYSTVTFDQWTTQYYFTVSSTYDSATGQGWYNSGSSVSSSVTRPVSGGTGIQYETTGWTGSGSLSSGGSSGSSTTGSFTITAVSSCTWNWKTQYLVTITSSGIGGDSSGTVATLDGAAKTQALLPYSVWFDSGASKSYSFSSSVSAGTGKQYVWSSTSGLSQTLQSNTFTVSTYGTITGAYLIQWQVTFTHTGLDASASGTVVTVDGTEVGYGSLSYSKWVYNGATVTYSYSNPVSSSTPGKRFSLSSVSGSASPIAMTSAVTVTGNYVVQWQVTITSSGVSGDSSGTVATLDGSPKTQADLPYAAWFNNGYSLAYAFSSPVSAGTGKQYAWSSTSGLSQTLQSNTFSVTGTGTITGTYGTQYKHTVTSSPATGTGYITVDSSVQTTPYATPWWNSGSSHTIAAVSPANTITGQSQYVYSSWSDSGTQSHSVSPTSSTTYTANFVLQYYLTVTGGSSPTGQNWYNSGTNAQASNAWIWGTSGGTRTALTNWQLDTVNQNPTRQNTGTFTTPNIAMSTYHTANFVSTTQYSLTLSGGANTARTGTASPTSDEWYDSGTTGVTARSDYVWNSVAGQSRNNLYEWKLDSGSWNTITRANTGTCTTPSQTMSIYHTITFGDTVQYYLTVTGGNSIGFGTSSPTADQWYDSGSSTTVSSNGIWIRSGGSGQRVSYWQIDSGTQNNVATTGTVTTSSVSMTAYHTVKFNAVTQYQVTLDSGATSALSSIISPTIGGDNYWYDSGVTVTVTLNGVYGRSGGSGTRVTGYALNGGSSTSESTTGIFNAFNGAISNHEYVTTTTVTQYQVTLDTGATNSLSSITTPTVSGDNYWYDSGTSVTLKLNGVWGRSGGSGNRLTGYALNGGSANPVSTTSTVTVFSGAISNHEYVTTTTVTQYQLTFDSGATSAFVSCTSPTSSGDNYWYDSGTTGVSATLNGVYGRSGGSGTRISSYRWDSGSSTSESTTGTFTTSTVTMSATHQVNTITATQCQVTLDSVATSALNSITSPTISADNYWYDSGTSVTVVLKGVWGRSGGVGNRLTGYALNGGSTSSVSTTSTVTVFSGAISNHEFVTATSTVQYFLTVSGGNGITYGTASAISGDTGWYDTGTSTTVLSNWVWDIVSGQSRYAVTNYAIDGISQNPTRQYSGTLTTSSVTMSTYHTVSFASIIQYYITFSQTGAGSDFTGTVVTIDATGYSVATLSHSFWWDSSSSHTFSFASPLDTGAGKRYSWTSTSGLSALQGGSITVSVSGSVVGNYGIQYYLTVSSARDSPTPVSGWFDSGLSITESVTSPFSGGTGIQYVCTGWAGSGSVPSSGSISSVTFTINAASTITWGWKTQYYLTVSSAYDSPTPVSGWFDSSSITASVTSPTAGSAGTQYVCIGWTGTGSVPSSGGSSTVTFTITAPSSITWNWKTQYQVTFAQSGVGSDFTGTVVTIDTDYTVATLPHAFWWDSSSSHTFSFASPLDTGAGKRYVWASTAGLSTLQGASITITTSGSITGNYVVQWRLTFTHSGLDSSATGTVVSINSVDKTYLNLPYTAWFNAGATVNYAYSDPVSSSTTGKRFDWTSNTGSASPITVSASETITGNYVVQWQVTITSAGISTDSSGTVATLGGNAKTSAQLPYSQWFDASSSVSYAFSSPVSTTDSNKRYVWSSTSYTGTPAQTLQSNTFTITGGGTLTGTYTIQYQVTITSSGISTDSSGTVATLDSDAKTRAQLPYAKWLASGYSLIYSFSSPVSTSDSNKRYVWSSTSGLSQTLQANIFSVTAGGTITGTYGIQWQVTITSSGIGVDTSGTVATLDGDTKTQAQLPYAKWLANAYSLTYLFSSPVSATAGKQYVWTSTSGLSQTLQTNTFSVTAGGSITGTYKTQFYFTVTSVYGSPTGQGWYDSGTTTVVSTIIRPQSGGAGIRYETTGWTGTGSLSSGGTSGSSTTGSFTITAYSTCTWNWKTQYQVTITSSGISGDSSGTVATLDGATKTQALLPYPAWFDNGYSLAYAFSSPVSASTGKQYAWSSTSGLAQTLQSNTFTVSTYGTITGAYLIQWQVTFTQAGVGSDFTGTVVTIDATGYYVATLSHAFWWDNNSPHTFSFASPLTVDAGKQYVWTTTTGGLSTLQGGSITVSASGSVVGNYGTQYYLTVTSLHGTVGGLGWYNSGATAYATVTPLTVAGPSGTQYVFTVWSGDASGSTSPSNAITMNGPKTATANWKTQYYLTVSSVYGTIGGQAWYDSGATAYATVTPLTVAGSAGTQYVFTVWSGDASGSTSPSDSIVMSAPKTATANWKTQYYLTVDTNPAEVLSFNPSAVSGKGWYDSGVEATVDAVQIVSKVTGQSRYDFRSWTGATPGTPNQAKVLMNAPKTATANYQLQYNITFSQTGAGSDFTGTVVTIDATGYYVATLPHAFWWDSSSSHTFSFASPLTVNAGKQYVWTSTSGLSTLQGGSITVSVSGSVVGNYGIQYYLAVTSSHGTVGGQGWYNSGATAYATVTPLTVAGPSGIQYVFTQWTGDASGSTSPSNPITLSGPKTATANWKTQYQITITSSGISTDSSGTVVTLAGLAYTQAQLPYPAWFDNGYSLNYAFSSPVSASTGKQYAWSSTNGLSQTLQASSFTVSTYGMITGTYRIQYQVTITSSGIGSDSSGTVATLDGVVRTKAQLPYFVWFDSGASKSYSFSSPVSAGTGKQYVWSSTSGLSQTLQSNTFTVSGTGTITGTYTVQWLVTFTHSGLDGSAVGDVVTVDGAGVQYGSLPYSKWVYDGTTVIYVYSDPVSSSTAGKRFRRASVTGSSSPITVSASETITGNYMVQWNVIFTHSGLDSSATGTVVTVNGATKTYTNLPFSDWYDAGSSITYSYSDPVSSSTTGKRFDWTSNTGSASPITVSASETITGNYVVQWQLTFTHSGLDSSAIGTVVTVDGSAKTYGDLPFISWYNAGAVITYSYSDPVTSSTADKQFDWTSNTGLASPITVSASSTVTGSYVVQWRVTFTHSGLDASATGTVVTVDTGGMQYGSLPYSKWVNNGATVIYAYTNPVSSSTTGKRFNLTSITGSSSPVVVTSSITVTGNYVVQWQITFTHSGLDASATGIVVTLDGNTKTYVNLPFLDWYNNGALITYSYTNPVSSSTTDKQFRLTSITGLVSPITVGSSTTVTGNYVVQWQITFTHVGLDSSASGTIVTVDGSAKTYSDLSFSKWVDSGATVTYGFTSPVSSSTTGKRFVLSSVSGPTSPATVTSTTTVTGNYGVQWLVTFTHSGLDSSAVGDVVTVDATGVPYGSLPYSKWVYNGTTVTYVYSDPVGSTPGKRFRLTEVTGPSSPATATSAVTVTGAYTIQVNRIIITACGMSDVVDTRTGGIVWYRAVYEWDNTPFTGSCGTLYLNGSAMTWATDRWTCAFPYEMSGSQTVFSITSVLDTKYGLTVINNVVGNIVLNWATMEITISKP